MKCLFLCLAFVLSCQLTACSKQPIKADSEVSPQKQWFEYLQGQYVGEQQIESATTGVTYPYHIYLPAGYAEHSKKSYPVIYVLDGQWNFQAYAWAMERNKFSVIVIGLEHGPKDSDRRNIDYVLPGALTFTDFITKEFIPVVESDLRIDPKYRSFQGTSLGGVAAIVMMLQDDPSTPLFQNYLADDASFWSQPEQMIDLFSQRLASKNSVNSDLYLTSAFPLGNYFSVSAFLAELESSPIPDLNVYHEWYFTTHEKIITASIDDTLRLIYKPKS
ncbi:hypothetical protein L0668_09700 [Paraglaciecola aquimarina]|uniref:Esterase n=1 Tax=Paraglaciecola algarum TaxID=3050085 RepID=A0ABS9D668_9ALTE|nr:alpha/beta hydrolase-fold protein [Paraglaciecola sp. G1-23]MCF2948380.1 hypothetical protein [Paraglaciecola sp. G1-23]